MEFLCIVSLLLGVLHSVVGDLHSALKHYDTLHHMDFHHKITRRSLDGNVIHERHIEFDTLGRHFHLNLRLSGRILSPQFKLVLIDKDLKEETLAYEANSMYEGYIYDEPWTSEAKVYFDDDDTLTATIATPNEVYNIEPTWRHNLSLSEPTEAKMIAYKNSDLVMDEDLGDSYCGFVREEFTSDDVNKIMEEEGDVEERTRREAVAAAQTSQSSNSKPHDTCRLLLVADYRFFKSMGQESVSRTTNYLIGLIDRVDGLYRRSNFSHGFSGMGFEIKEIRIHQHEAGLNSIPQGLSKVIDQQRFNNETDMGDSWKPRRLLETFSRDSYYKSFCLAHLFTHQSFEGGVLGLAYIGSPRTYSVGGICSPAYYKGGYRMYLNTGWSSSLNRYNRRLLTSEADLVTTHGHNWGSEHDPDSVECSPSTKDGGKHIMYTYSVSGYEPNNKLFSPCSKRAIGAVLQSKAKTCFSEKSSGFCGNYELEEGEECDVGLGVQTDPCCTSDCKLRPLASCSDLNQACCVGCQVAPSSHICHEAKNGSCEAEGHCNGVDFTCPPPPHKPDKSPCLERGECRKGKCLSLCESHSMVTCICDDKDQNPANASWCKWCCQKDANSKCEPIVQSGGTLDLPDGTPCVQGFCAKGVCEKQVQDLVERFWDIIENISPSDLVHFMRANIVGTIIVLSLVIWIPASCFISYIDRKQRRDEENEQYWHSAENKDLYEWEKPVLNIRRLETMQSRPSLRVHLPPSYAESTYI